MSNSNNCTNCSHDLNSGSQYCNLCGQSIICFERPFRPAFMDMIHETLDIDGRMVQTLKTLILKPGLLSLEYCQGKRMKYTPPLRMYLVISIIFFLLFPLLQGGGSTDSVQAAVQASYPPKIMFCLLPVFAFMLQLLFRGTFYLSNLIFAIHVHCVGYLIFLVGLLLSAIIDSNHSLDYIIAFMRLPLDLYLLVYCALALKRNYGQSWKKTMMKYVLLIVSYFAILKLSFDIVLQSAT